MKHLKHTFLLLMLGSVLLNCSNDSDSDDSPNLVSGTITLSGDEAAELGGSLTVGNIIEGAAQTGTSQSVTLVDENVKVTNGEITPTDPANTFIIVTAQFESDASVTKTVSMAINVDGKTYQFACSSPKIGDFTECGDNFEVNQTEKRSFSTTQPLSIPKTIKF